MVPKNSLFVVASGEWTLYKRPTFFAIRHNNGMSHTGSARYIQKLWNDRFAKEPNKRVCLVG